MNYRHLTTHFAALALMGSGFNALAQEIWMDDFMANNQADRTSSIAIGTDRSRSKTDTDTRNSKAFIYTAKKGFTTTGDLSSDYVYLPSLKLGEDSSANAISRDGKVVIGSSGNKTVFWKNNVPTALTFNLGAGFEEDFSFARFVSADGGIIVGDVYASNKNQETQFYRPFRWTAATNGQLLDLLGPANSSFASAAALSADGSTIIGSASGLTFESHAVFWKGTAITDIHPRALDVSTTSSQAEAVSADGSVIALNVNNFSSNFSSTAYRWTQATGAKALGKLASGTSSFVSAMNPTGDVLVGAASIDLKDDIPHAFRWTTTGGIQDIHASSLSGNASEAQFVSDRGDVVVGYHYTEFTGNEMMVSAPNRTFRWTAATGAVDIGGAAGKMVNARAVTPDGRVIVGQVGQNRWWSESSAVAAAAVAPMQPEGFRWNAKDGFQTVKQWLGASGVTLADTVKIVDAFGVSDDGSIVFGYLDNEELYIAKGNSGLISVAEATKSVAQTAAAVGSTRTSAGLVLGGAHGHPLARRSEEGRFLAWAGGDYGNDDHGSRDGFVSVAEAGGGYNFGLTQLNLAIGRTDSRQNTDVGGQADHTGTFVIADLITPLGKTPFVFTLTGIYQWSTLDIRRGYLNAGFADGSNGDTDAATFGGAARLDWENAVVMDDLSFSPYTKFVVTQSKIDGFTETGGGFPASYAEQTDTISDLHLGTNASYMFREDLRLVMTVAGVYRFQDSASNGSVSVPGVTTGFASIAGEDYRQFWLIGGIGVDYDVGAGTVSVMLNSTTEGPAASLWLATSYQYKF
jgi:uncharacterized membrane protein